MKAVKRMARILRKFRITQWTSHRTAEIFKFFCSGRKPHLSFLHNHFYKAPNNGSDRP